ncbi:MAG TPA: hypothetical protein VNT79_09185 [Phycisphaerae bacterium]|nr:hypothetical protein [Phycisphaerae bacterium]
MMLLPFYFVVQVFGAPMPPRQFNALREIEIETAVGAASIFRMHFDLSRNLLGEFDVLEFDIFRPLAPVTIRLSPGIGVPLTIVNGYVRDTQLSVSNTPGQSRLEVVCVDALGSTMAQRHVAFPYPNTSDGNAAAIIFARNGMIPRVDPVPVTRPITDGTNLQHQSDAEHLFALAGTLGYQLYIQPEPISGRDIGNLHRPQAFLPPQGVLSIDLGIATNLESFSVSYDALRPTTVVTTVVDPQTRTPIPILAFAATDPPMGLEPTLFRVVPPNVERPLGNLGATPAEAQEAAFARVNETSRCITATGEVNGTKYRRPLLVGMPVLVRGAGRRDSGVYQVERVTHRISRDNYTQNFTATRNALGLTGAELFFDPLSAA